VFALDRDLRYTAFNRAHAAVMRALYGCVIAVGGRLLDYQTVAAGVVVGVVVQARDVTQHERAEPALSQNRTLLAAVIEGTSDAVYVKDTAGRYLLFNAGAERVTGKRAEDVLGKDDRFLFPADEAAVVMALFVWVIPFPGTQAGANRSGDTVARRRGPQLASPYIDIVRLP
jgi:PAS domain-containing protein